MLGIIHFEFDMTIHGVTILVKINTKPINVLFGKMLKWL